MIRTGRPDDVEIIRDIERAAGRSFLDVGMADIAAHEPIGAAPLREYIADGRCWIATDNDNAVGYVIADIVDGCGHVEQLSVVPSHQGRGFGRSLIDAVDAWARQQGLSGLTLTTFNDVPFNRPLYEHLGFRVLSSDELTPPLLALREEEAGYGLDPARRVVMRRSF